MKNKNKILMGFVFLIVIIISQLNFISAKTETLHKGWIIDSEIKNIEDKDFFVKKHFDCEYIFDKSSTKNILQFISADCEYVAYIKFMNTIYNTFYKNSTNADKDLYCKIIDKHYEVCLLDIEYSHHNKTLGKDIFKFNVEITKKSAEVKIEKKVDKDTLYIREPTSLEIKLIAGEDLAATDVYYQETFENFFLSNSQGCKIINTNKIIISKAALNVKEEYVCKFDLFSKVNQTYTSEGELTYNNGIKQISYKPGSKKEEKIELEIIENEFNSEWNFSQTNENNHTFEIGDEIILYLNLSNSHKTDEIDTNNIYLNLKDAGRIDDLPKEWKWTEKGYVLNKKILPENSTNFTLKIKFKRSGNYDFEYSGHYIIGERIKKTNISHNFEIKAPKTSFFNLTYIKLMKGATQDVYFTFINPTKHPLKNIELKLKSDFLEMNQTFFFKDIKAREFKDVEFEKLVVPDTNRTQIPISVDVNYMTEFNEKINFEINFSVPLYYENGERVILNKTNTTNKSISEIIEELEIEDNTKLQNAKEIVDKNEYLIIGIVAILIMVILIVMMIVYKRNFSG